MKNFSAKNAEFETLKINNEAAITSADIGTAPNKIPLNKDLGSLAYQDAVNLDDVSADMIELRAIAAEISDSAVNVFVYDTSRDSDGGEWRKRTQNTSWYNEELNTATRGARREFPAVAMIVTEANRVAIYDGDDPDLGMWMVLESGGTFGSGDAQLIGNSTVDQVASIMFNGALVTCNSDSYHSLLVVNFLSETSQAFRHIGNYIIPHNIAERHVRDLGVPTFSGNAIVHSTINDVAMTVLPNAPIDNETGLPVPTIAVATDGGVSVIRDDGTVVDYTCTYNSNNKYSLINFIGDSKLLACSRDGETYPTVFDIPSQDKASFDSTDIVFTANPSDSSSAADISVGNYSEYKASAVTKEHIAMGGTSLIISNIDNVSGNQTADNVIISSSYNTGWMPGDIKLAALSDSVVGDIQGTELITNGDFSTALGDEWSDESTGTGSISLNASGYIDLISQGSGNRAIADQSFSTVIGKTYTLSLDVIATDGNSSVYLGASAGANDITSGALNLLSLGVHSFTFVATTTTTFIRLWGSTESSTNSFDNISVRLAVEDRSVNDNGLQIVGEIQKTPVASGADLVAYSGFSANNYLMQPYNADLDFGTGDFSIGFWFNFSAGVEGQKWDDLFSLGDLGYKGVAGVTPFIHAQLNTVSDYLDLYIGTFNTSDRIARIAGLSRNVWHHVVLNRKDGVATAFINGSQYFSKNNNISISGAGLDQYNLKIGYAGDNYGNIGVGFPANYSKIALFRISKTAPTAEQIAKIYRDEKPLFKEGAQATLYGTSDAVTALAYDDSEQLLHVGTASGRSDFRGLARVNNTTTAISNSISAAEGTIIQN